VGKSEQEAQQAVKALGIKDPRLVEGLVRSMMDVDPGIHTPDAIRGLVSEMLQVGRGGTPLEVANHLSLYSGIAAGALTEYAEMLERVLWIRREGADH